MIPNSPTYIYIGLNILEALYLEPLHQLAWALQERLLSVRKVFFTCYGMIWQCVQCEAGENGRLFHGAISEPLSVGSDLGNTAAHTLWKQMIQSYSTFGLTFPKDRLIAISALAECLHGKFRTDFSRSTFSADGKPVYLAGLWSSDLSLLLWNCRSDHKGSFCGKDILEMVSTFPSWSWASTPRGVCFTHYGGHPVARLSGHHAGTERSNTYGNITACWLRLEAPLLLTSFAKIEVLKSDRDRSRPYEELSHIFATCGVVFHSSILERWGSVEIHIDPHCTPEEGIVGFLVISTDDDNPCDLSGILVTPSKDGTAFVRVGTFSRLPQLDEASIERIRTTVKLV